MTLAFLALECIGFGRVLGMELEGDGVLAAFRLAYWLGLALWCGWREFGVYRCGAGLVVWLGPMAFRLDYW